MQIIKKRSVIPIYAIGLVWLLYALIFPLYRLADVLIVLGVSIGVSLLLRKVIPAKEIKVELPPLLSNSSDSRVNEMIIEVNSYITQIRTLNDQIDDVEISRKITHIEDLTKKIFDEVVEDNQTRSSVRRFLNYYLPTTVKLLKAYEDMEEQDTVGENIVETMKKINEMLSTIGNAFEKQLDKMFADDALDISTDITVFESILKQEDLIGESISDMQK